jgi:hypothetical protein
MGKLRVRRAAKVCFAVACKVIACNIKRWARAAAGSDSLLGRLLDLARALLRSAQAAVVTLASIFRCLRQGQIYLQP